MMWIKVKSDTDEEIEVIYRNVEFIEKQDGYFILHLADGETATYNTDEFYWFGINS